MTTNRFNRRQFTFGSAAALMSASLLSTHAAAEISESHTTKDGFAEISWDPDLWKVDGDLYDTGILLRNLEYKAFGDDTYYLSITSGTPEFGDVHPEEAIDLHIEDWFSQGMLTAEIVDRWVTDTAFGYLFTSGAPDDRTFCIFDYRKVPSSPGTWVGCSVIVDQVLFDEETTADMLDGVEINGEGLFSDRTTEEIIDLFVEHYDLES